MHDPEFREFTWGENWLDYPYDEVDFCDARQRIVEKFVIGKSVRIIVPKKTPVTPQMIKFFAEMTAKAARLGVHFVLQVCSKMVVPLEQAQTPVRLVLEPL